MPVASSNFLVPNGTLIVEVIAFLVVLGFMAKYVLPFVNKALEERQEQIRTALEAAERAKAEADETRAERHDILEQARQQAREIVANANTTAERVRGEAVQRGQQEYERIVSGAEAEIALARQRAIDEVSTRLGSLVLSVARQVIGREIDAEAHRGLIDEAVAALQAAPDSSAGAARG
jgi:F-type H+-transporting ATPase subunit b